MQLDSVAAITTRHPGTGPKTEAGKAKSSRNAIRTGLYAARDFMREGEEEEYAQTLIKLMDELTPEGVMEQTFATEIMGATWRLRRCRLVEEAFSSVEDLDFDPMVDERTEKQQRSVDRARAQSHLILRRSLAELEKLQRARSINAQLAEQAKPAQAPSPSNPLGNLDALMAMADAQLARQYRENGMSSFCNVPPVHEAPPVAPHVPDLPSSIAPSSFCKPATPQAQRPGRNTPCPCGSGTKYKRCCGNTVQPLLNRAA